MKKICALTFIALIPMSALSEVKRHYGVDLSQSQSDASCSYIQEIVTNPLYTHDCSDKAVGFQLLVDWEKGGNVIELGYMDFGGVTSKAHFYGFPDEETAEPQITIKGKFEAKGVNVSYKRHLDISENAKLYATIGGVVYESQGKDIRIGNGSGSNGFTRSHNGVSAKYGIGYQYKWIDISYGVIKDVKIKELGDTDIKRLSLGFRFSY